MGKRTKFNDVTKRLLAERLAHVKKGFLPPFSDMRHFFYECRNVLLRENPDMLGPDGGGKEPYSNWLGMVARWCDKYTEDFGISEGLWWRVRERLNLFAKARATCEGVEEKFLVDKKTRHKIAKGCSFILVCEKETVTNELMAKLQNEDYLLNVVATGGKTTSDVQEAVLSIAEDLGEAQNFYVLVLHDYDLDGVGIYYKLKERYKNAIDVGVGPSFIKFLKKRKSIDLRLVEEQKLNMINRDWVKEHMLSHDEYSLSDFEYLYGEPYQVIVKGKEKTYHKGRRIEIDAIHVQYGIKPFIDYILKQIKKRCTVWDLTRIGVNKDGYVFQLHNPDCRFEERMDGHEDPDYITPIEKIEECELPFNYAYAVRSVWRYLDRILKPPFDSAKEKLQDLVDSVSSVVQDDVIHENYEEFQSVLDEYKELENQSESIIKQATDLEGETKGDLVQLKEEIEKDISALKDVVDTDISTLRNDFENDFDMDWIESHREEHQDIIDQIENYEGDVRKGKKDLIGRVEKIQEKMENGSKNNPRYDEFHTKLEELEQKHSEEQKQVDAKVDEGIEQMDSKWEDFDSKEELIEDFQGLDEKRILELIVEVLQDRLKELVEE